MKAKKQVANTVEECPHCGKSITRADFEKPKKWHEKTSVTLCIAAGLAIFGLGFIHIVTGVVSPFELPFDVFRKESFGYRETFINAEKIKALRDKSNKKSEPKTSKSVDRLYSWQVEVRHKQLELLSLGAKAFRHNSAVSEPEPRWGSVNKTKLPRLAFADMGEADRVSSWRFPHHWVKNGGSPDEDGRWTTGTMYRHKAGLNAAWAAAQGARAGVEASAAVKAHLQRHRSALGLE